MSKIRQGTSEQSAASYYAALCTWAWAYGGHPKSKPIAQSFGVMESVAKVIDAYGADLAGMPSHLKPTKNLMAFYGTWTRIAATNAMWSHRLVYLQTLTDTANKCPCPITFREIKGEDIMALSQKFNLALLDLLAAASSCTVCGRLWPCR